MPICLSYIPLGTGPAELNDLTLPVTFVPTIYVNTGPQLIGHLQGIDNEFVNIYTGSLVQLGVVNPSGLVTPDFIGQIYINTALLTFWISDGLTNIDWIQLAVGPGSGEANTASNAGLTGIGLTLAKVGVDLPFKSVTAGLGIGLTNDVPNKSVVVALNASMDDLNNVSTAGILAGQTVVWNGLAFLPGAVGEVNLGSNIGVGGVGVFAAKSGVTLQFRNVGPASSKVTVVLDAPNNRINIDVDPSQISIGALADVDLTGLIVGQTIVWNGVDFVPGAVGQINTASNVNVGGVGVFKQKTGVNFEFRGVNAASSKLSVVLDAPNNEIDLDVVPGNITLGSLSAMAIGAIAPGQSITWNGVNFVPYTPATGDITNAANVGAGGVGPFNAKVGTVLNFRNINAGSSKITVTLDVPNSEIDIDVDPSQINVDDLGNVIAPAVNGDIFFFDGTNWINARKVGPGHSIGAGLGDYFTAGAANALNRGDNGAYKATDAVVLGRGGSAFAPTVVVFQNGSAFGRFARAGGELAHAVGDYSDAAGDPSVRTVTAGGDGSKASGAAAEAIAHYSDVHGEEVLAGPVGYRPAALTYLITNTDLLIVGEDLTSVIAPGDEIIVYALSGGTFNPQTDTLVYRTTVNTIAFALGDTTINILVGIPTALACRFVIPSKSQYALVRGYQSSALNSRCGVAIGDNVIVYGDFSFGFGVNVQAGLPGGAGGSVAIGYGVLATLDYSMATGRESETRNRGEAARAGFQWSSTRKAQTLNDVVGVEILAAGPATDNLTLDGVSAGPEITTATGHSYTVVAYVNGNIDAGAGLRLTAAWKLEALFVNEGGTLRQVGVTITTPIANDNVVNYPTAPVFAVPAGATLRITVAKDGAAAATVTWDGSVMMLENGR